MTGKNPSPGIDKKKGEMSPREAAEQEREAGERVVREREGREEREREGRTIGSPERPDRA